MYAVAAVGVLLILSSALMMIRPAIWSRGILAFARWPYFHIFELASRIVLGAILVAFAQESLHPQVIAAVGYLLVAVGLGLAVVGPRRHRAFARRSATYTALFRPAGAVGVAFGAFMVMSALGLL